VVSCPSSPAFLHKDSFFHIRIFPIPACARTAVGFSHDELCKNMRKTGVVEILRGNRRARIIQMGDPSDPSGDLGGITVATLRKTTSCSRSTGS
jgi:hypothetical protein